MARPGAMQPDTARRLAAMRDVIVHRGPDDAGSLADAEVALGSRRLAILDLSPNGHMPMQTEDGRFSIVYNGETYNFQELRHALEAKGHRFRSGSDTEVLLRMYQDQGPGMLNWLNGMFAVAIWDSVEHSLFIARDRLGVKPLCYAEQDGTFYFASEEKALFAAGVRPEFDPAAWDELLMFRYTAGPVTPYRNVHRLPPGHCMTWRDGKVTIRRWWNLADRARQLRDAVPGDPGEWFSSTFDDAVNRRRISDVPVGVLLSGGLDSSSIAASLGSQKIPDISSFTVRFRDAGFDEGPLAAAVARRWGLRHHELVLGDENLFSLVEQCSWLNDVPLVHANEPHLFAISQYAKPYVTVLLSGEGADETLGGYVRYRPLRYLHALARAQGAITPVLRRLPTHAAGSITYRMQKMVRLLAAGGPDEIALYDACDVLPNDVLALGYRPSSTLDFRRSMLEEGAALYPGDVMRQAMYLDQHTFLVSVLDRNDRTTMGASIECRVPFLDYRLVEGLAALPSRTLLRGWKGKSLLRNAFRHRLPPEIVKHRKWGFGVPWVRHFQTDPRFREVIGGLPEAAPIADGPFDRGLLRREIDQYLKGDARNHAIIRQLVFIAIWYQACIANGGNWARVPLATLT